MTEANKDHMDANKRIAKNTIFLYMRLFVAMTVTLYTTRVVMEALGIIDYGIYNVVGGLSAAFIFFSSALTNATQRFLNFEIGKNSGDSALNRIFCLSFLIYAIIAISVFVIGSVVGVWYITNRMVIPPDRISAAIVTLFCMLLSLLVTFVGTVYESVLIARENMKIYAWVGLFDAGAKLAVALILLVTPSSRLIVYAVLLALFQIISKLYVVWYCRRNYSETKLSFYWNRTLFREMFAFAGWNVFGTAAWTVNEQGITLLVNKFFGLMVNAARGVTWQVSAAVNNLSSGFFTAIRPQMIQSYASGDLSRFSTLIYSGTRYSVYLMWLISLPLILRIDSVLAIWLKVVPPDTGIFVQWALIYCVINAITNPLWCGIQAVGKLRSTILYGSSFFLLVFPISWLLIRNGAPAVVTYQVMSAIRVGYIAICFVILKGYVADLTYSGYMLAGILPCVLVCFISGAIAGWIDLMIPDGFPGLVSMATISIVITALTVFFIGLNSNERKLMLSKLVRK